MESGSGGGGDVTQWEDCNLFDCIVEICEFIDRANADKNQTKQDLAEACKLRCNFMLRKALMHPSSTSMSLVGWNIMPADG